MTICSKCGEPHQRKNQRYCLGCHAAYNRAWKPAHPLNAKQKVKANARSYAGVYQRRGKLKRQPCQCGETKTEMHHPDYEQPLLVLWMCRPCHIHVHRANDSVDKAA